MAQDFELDPSPFARHWTLDPQVDYLNHGSFGACPRTVLEAQAELRARLEREPMDFLVRRLPSELARARAALGAFVGADADDLAFVSNATGGVNAVLRSLDLRPGDELLTSDHAYGACRKSLEYAAARAGARVVVASLPFPLRDASELIEPFLAAATPRTRLALVDHVSSPTGLVFPVEQLVPALRARGIETLIDGAHALGMLPLDLDRLGAAWYTGNAHKWLCAPKGSAFLHARRDRQPGLHPLVISHGYDPAGRFRDEWDWTGTLDPTPWLVIPECLAHVGGLLPGGWPALMARNHALALAARDVLLDAAGVEAPAPGDLLGALASVPLPAAAPGTPAAALSPEGLMDYFRQRGVESWAFAWPRPDARIVRASAQLYNSLPQFRRLARLLREAWSPA
jgi:isopenicillin-N epimerase